MPKLTRPTLITGALLLACVALRIADPDAVARLRLLVFDTYLRSAPRIADPTFPVRFVAIDEASLAREGQWPWPRTKLAALVEKLKEAGARSIAFDFLLAEPDRLSPSELARVLDGNNKDLEQLRSEIAKLPSNDARMAEAVSGAPVVLGVAGDQHGSLQISSPRASLSFAGDDPQAAMPHFAHGIDNVAVLADAAKGIGAVNWLPSQDQIVRRVPLLVSIAGKAYPSLALEAFRIGANESTVFVKSSGGSGMSAFGQRTGIESVRVGHTVLPTDSHGELWLKFAVADPRRSMSASNVLDGSFDKSAIQGRYILIGATAAGLLDLRATPLEPSVAGVEIHAQALEQILSGEHLVRPAYATGLELVFLLAAGALVAWLIATSGALAAAIAGVGSTAGVILLSWLAYAKAGLLFDPIFPGIAVALLYGALSLSTYLKSELERGRIRSAFGHYLAPSLVEKLANSHDDLKLGGEERVVTLLFADVRGFSRISEGLDAEALIRFVNRLFTPFSDTILRNGGTIDKFMGDAVMAFWNAPVLDAEHAQHACRAALGMLDDLAQLNAMLAAEASAEGRVAVPVRIGIGINTGPGVVGNVGSPQRFDYSVLGDVVNVAARFEEATKVYGCDIIVGEKTASAISDFAVLELATVALRGKEKSERVFALIGDETVGQSDGFQKLKPLHANLVAAMSNGRRTDAAMALADCVQVGVRGSFAIYDGFAQRLRDL